MIKKNFMCEIKKEIKELFDNSKTAIEFEKKMKSFRDEKSFPQRTPTDLYFKDDEKKELSPENTILLGSDKFLQQGALAPGNLLLPMYLKLEKYNPYVLAMYLGVKTWSEDDNKRYLGEINNKSNKVLVFHPRLENGPTTFEFNALTATGWMCYAYSFKEKTFKPVKDSNSVAPDMPELR